MIIDLRSDTVTKPSAAMLQAMMAAEVGDDVFAEDPTVKRLEEKTAAMFGMEAGLFCPSGTMTNQIAVKVNTQPLDEVIGDKLCHIYNYETGGVAFHSGASMRLTECDRGIMTPDAIAQCILPDNDWYANTRLVCIENTVNKGGGAVYSLAAMKEISHFCSQKNLKLHLDGARIFNALAAIQQQPIALKGLFETISVCLSKGLGAPAGSVLLGSAELIKKARKIRKVMGGGMRQSGILAAAGIYALDNNVTRLWQDHDHAQKIAGMVKKIDWVRSVLPVETNIVIFEVDNAAKRTAEFEEVGIKVSPFSSTHVRMVTHLDFSSEMLLQLESRLGKWMA
ncbi:MAG: GntG family PLP-dependent aldolase [Chitinophagales bacterium]